MGPVNPPLHQDHVRVQRLGRRFTTICSRNWFTIPLGGSSIPQSPEGINKRPLLGLGLRLRLRPRLGLTLWLWPRLRRPRARKDDPQSPFKWKIMHLDPYHIKVTEVHVESMLYITFHPHTVDVVEKTGGGVPFQVGMISKFNIPPRLGTRKRLAGAFFAAIGPFSNAIHACPPAPRRTNRRESHDALQSSAFGADVNHGASRRAPAF